MLVWCAAWFCTYQLTCAEILGEPGCLLSSIKSRVSSNALLETGQCARECASNPGTTGKNDLEVFSRRS